MARYQEQLDVRLSDGTLTMCFPKESLAMRKLREFEEDPQGYLVRMQLRQMGDPTQAAIDRVARNLRSA